MSDRLHVERRDETSVVFLDHPPTNALGEALAAELTATLREVLSAGPVRAVILASKVRYAFCSGLDLGEIYDPGDPRRTGRNTVRATEASAALARLVGEAAKPVLAAIDGIVVGSGVTLALACDLRVCSEVAQFWLPDVQYGGLLGDGGIELLCRVAGQQPATELLLLGERVRAARAQALGLVDRVVPQGRELDEALRLAAVLARRAPRSLAGCKRVLRAAPEDRARLTRELLADIVESRDTFEGLRAFAEQRPPKFEGR